MSRSPTSVDRPASTFAPRRTNEWARPAPNGSAMISTWPAGTSSRVKRPAASLFVDAVCMPREERRKLCWQKPLGTSSQVNLEEGAR